MTKAQALHSVAVDELFERARGAKRSAIWWRCVGQLHRVATRQVFEGAADLLDSAKASDRSLGAYVLSQLGYERKALPFRAESIHILLRALDEEQASEALEGLVVALCRLYSRRAIPKLALLAEHPAAEVRQALAAELIHCTLERGWGDEHPDARVRAVLTLLSGDRVGAVRNWACFSLGNSIQDSPELREALVRRLRDRHVDTRVEAVAGLARRNDQRAVDPLLEILGRRSWRLGTWVTSDLVTFAGRTRDRRFIPYLDDLLKWDLSAEEVAEVDESIARIKSASDGSKKARR